MILQDSLMKYMRGCSQIMSATKGWWGGGAVENDELADKGGRKVWFYGFCRTQFFSDSPPNLSCFPPNFIKFSKIYQTLTRFTKFSKFYQSFTKFVIYTVWSWFWIVLICALFPPLLYPQKAMVDKKLVFPTLSG